jgi:glycyl-tRNA synthetase beta chain
VAARLSDGEFFYKQDRKHRLDHFVLALDKIIFHERLGSVYEKSERLEKMTSSLAAIFDLNQRETQNLERAAHLCKADLTTSLVAEFPSLQGEIGRIYAQEDKEDKVVARAISEHYWPRFAGDRLPKSKVGQVLAIADRVDTLTSFFAVGIRPKGSQDPYALRRTALGLVQILSAVKKEVKLADLLRLNRQFLPVKLSEGASEELISFIKARIKADLKEKGVKEDVIRAVLSGQKAEDVYSLYETAKILFSLRKEKWFKEFVLGAKRVQNIINETDQVGKINDKLLIEKSEVNLYKAYLKNKKIIDQLVKDRRFKQAICTYQNLIDPIIDFFEKVLVMTDDEKIRNNRLSLLGHLHELTTLLFNPASVVL